MWGLQGAMLAAFLTPHKASAAPLPCNLNPGTGGTVPGLSQPHSWIAQSLAPHLSLKEVLGPLNALGGDIDLGKAGQYVQATVFLQLSCGCLAEDQKELQRGGPGVSGAQREQSCPSVFPITPLPRPQPSLSSDPSVDRPCAHLQEAAPIFLVCPVRILS